MNVWLTGHGLWLSDWRENVALDLRAAHPLCNVSHPRYSISKRLVAIAERSTSPILAAEQPFPNRLTLQSDPKPDFVKILEYLRANQFAQALNTLLA